MVDPKQATPEMTMTLKTTNKIVLWFLIILCVLTTAGLLNFGHGLGNIIYMLPIIIATVGHIIVTRLLNRKSNNDYWLPISTISLIICVGIIYKTTVGRGPEFSWNGEIFFIK
jgi:hypothetical protein